MDNQQMRDHAASWVASWNAHDLDAIMTHYGPDVRFAGPTVVERWGKADGVLKGTNALRRHFARGLELAPDVHFELLSVLIGVDGMTILYRRETNLVIADVVVMDEQSRAVNVRVYVTHDFAVTHEKVNNDGRAPR